MQTAYIDTETLGLYGPMAILQYAFDDDAPTLYNPWLEPAGKTRALIRRFIGSRIVAHNLTFDHQKLHGFWAGISNFADDERPIDDVERFVRDEYECRNDACLKPAAAVCTLLVCQKELGGSALAAKEIRVRKVPEHAADLLAGMLNEVTDLPKILFARHKIKRKPWGVAESDAGAGWSDVVLKFAPSNGLKDVAKYVLGHDGTQKIGAEVLPPQMPDELGYCPYVHVLAHRMECHDMQLWPELLQSHIDFWNTDPSAVKYALDDIILLRDLDHYLTDKGLKLDTDFDSEIACQVASCRMAGFTIDHRKLGHQISKSQEVVDDAKINVDSPKQVREYLGDVLDPLEQHVIADSCDKSVLKSIVKEFNASEREECCGDGCEYCEGKGYIDAGPLPVANRAAHILDVRKHKKRMQLYSKLLTAGAAFPSFRVIGAKSGRMSGADGLNYHGIDSSNEIREIFNLTRDKDWVVCGGDMNSQELAIAAAVMKDESLGDVLRENKKLHAIFAASASGLPYDQIMKYADDKSRPESKWYAQGKVCAYSIMYGASAFNVSQTLGCEMDVAQQRIDDFFAQFPHMAETRKAVKQTFTVLTSDADGRMVLRQPEKNYVESAFGFRRSFQTELDVMFAIRDAMRMVNVYRKERPELAPVLNKAVIRKEKKGIQRTAGALSSALYACIFSLQGKILRAALNHLIQSAGRTCTLRVQKRIWDEVQPQGIHPFEVKLMSVHDEIATVSPTRNVQTIEDAVVSEMADLTATIPLLSLDWGSDVGSWYGVKSATEGLVRCGWGAE